jgi:isoleucyl-tRNA synthetase
MSKSQGNVVSPHDIIKENGADILRLWVATSDYREDIRVSPQILKALVDVYRRIRNTLRYVLGNINDFNIAADRVPHAAMLEIDRWALHKLQKLIHEVRVAYDLYEFHRAWTAVNLFCANDMSAFYFDVLKDRLYTWDKKGIGRRSAQTALFEIVHGLTRLLAPLASFTAEEAWQVMKSEHPEFLCPESVLLADMPKPDDTFVSDDLEKTWVQLRGIREKALAALERARQEGAIGSSLEAEIIITASAQLTADLLRQYQPMLDMLCIVSKLRIEDAHVEDAHREAELIVTVRKAPGAKCSRCWRWQEDTVVVDGEALCGRCQEVVGGARA